MDKNFFEWFGLEASFQVDPVELKRLFFQKSREVHPDRNDAEDSLTLASYNNEAYRTLKTQSLRYPYILEQYCEAELSDDLPQEFLLEMMDLNEAAMMGDEESLKAELVRLRTEWEESVSVIVAQSPDSLSTDEWAIVKEHLLKQRYLERLEQRTADS